MNIYIYMYMSPHTYTHTERRGGEHGEASEKRKEGRHRRGGALQRNAILLKGIMQEVCLCWPCDFLGRDGQMSFDPI